MSRTGAPVHSCSARHRTNEDVSVTIRDAFDAVRRRLEVYERQRDPARCTEIDADEYGKGNAALRFRDAVARLLTPFPTQ